MVLTVSMVENLLETDLPVLLDLNKLTLGREGSAL